MDVVPGNRGLITNDTQRALRDQIHIRELRPATGLDQWKTPRHRIGWADQWKDDSNPFRTENFKLGNLDKVASVERRSVDVHGGARGSARSIFSHK